MEPFIGTVMIFGGNFAPVGWFRCDGALLPIASYQALYAVIGPTYGGDGRSTFALPNLSGRAALGAGQGPGLPSITLGQQGGTPQASLSAANMPAHDHPAVSTIAVSAQDGRMTSPVNNVLAVPSDEIYVPPHLAADPSAGSMGVTTTLGAVGQGQPIAVMQPYLGVNFIIAVEGIFPSQS